MSPLLSRIKAHKAGQACGIYAVCSANPLVLEATILQAKQNNSILLVESTSNQVNQFGGYTGMQPTDFSSFVQAIAKRLNFPLKQLILGGDHLGPNCWQSDTSEVAMQKSEQLIRAYINAGFEKIHLDCSMACIDDELPLADSIIAERAARLCEVAEQSYLKCIESNPNQRAPLYVIGTEVPVPGGAQENLEPTLEVSNDQDALNTLKLHSNAFNLRGLEDAWQRIIALVVQPGVEFDHQSIMRYQPSEAKVLSHCLNDNPNIVFEAHSTDYQPANAFKELVVDHFAILKVGPALTFALREVLFALSDIEAVLVEPTQRANLKVKLEEEMLKNPQYWQSYYQGTKEEQFFARQFSFSDRCRYYWPQPKLAAAITQLIENLSAISIPITLLSQYLPMQYQAIIDNKISNEIMPIIYFHIQQVTAPYARACKMETSYDQ